MNVLPAHEAIYHWEGRVEEAREVALLAKTTRAGFEPLRARVRALHPYDTPCIVALPVAAGDAGYLAWIRAEASREEAPRERTPGEGASKEGTSGEGTP